MSHKVLPLSFCSRANVFEKSPSAIPLWGECLHKVVLLQFHLRRNVFGKFHFRNSALGEMYSGSSVFTVPLFGKCLHKVLLPQFHSGGMSKWSSDSTLGQMSRKVLFPHSRSRGNVIKKFTSAIPLWGECLSEVCHLLWEECLLAVMLQQYLSSRPRGMSFLSSTSVILVNWVKHY